MSEAHGERVSLATIAREWLRIGVTGFGGPPAHIALLSSLAVRRRGWLTEREFEEGVAATNLLPGPASTQLAIFIAWRLRGAVGGILAGVCFIVPGLALILALATLFLAAHPPLWTEGAAAGAGAAVPAVAVQAALGLAPASWRRAGASRAAQTRWLLYLLAGVAASAGLGPYLVLVLFACGAVEVATLRPGRCAVGGRTRVLLAVPLALTGSAVGGLAALVWVAFKVGALSYGGGFVIIPLMQHDAVSTYHWMSAAQFLNAVALGQITPGPVVQTVAVVGYAAAGLAGGLLAALVAFAPSFLFVIVGGPRFGRLRTSTRAQAFLTGAGAAAIGAIMGAAIPLALALSHLWQLGVLALAAAWLLRLRRGVVPALLGAALLGVVAALLGAPIGH